jgi:MtN3 and saliva related transmembrane protein
MAALWIESIGLLAGVIGIFAWIPQIIEVWVHKKHEGLSITSFGVVAIALTLWLIYGVLVDSFAMIAANIMTLSVIAAIIIGALRARRNE